jgi:coenzyme PQQ precursor peptide PqqA
MLISVRAARRARNIHVRIDMVSPRICHHGEMPMIWETPVAIDFRFGMEITMYVSNR